MRYTGFGRDIGDTSLEKAISLKDPLPRDEKSLPSKPAPVRFWLGVHISPARSDSSGLSF
jgi:hypothetical protein